MPKFTTERITSISQLGRELSSTTVFMHEAISRKVGLSGIDHKYLSILLQHGPMTAGQLSEYTGLTTGAITALLDRLEKKKLIHRTFDKTDRRKIVVVPNEVQAKKLMGTVNTALQSKIINLMKKLPERDVVVIENYLISAIEVMKEFTKDLNTSKFKK
jgi:DNA-binding MarR family transcriptional regulator